MSKYPNDAELQFAGCAALATLANANSDNQNIIRECGGIPVVLDVFRNHSHYYPRNALMALARLACENEVNKEIICKCGAIPLISKAMEEHPIHPRISSNGCLAIAILSAGDSDIGFVDLGAVELILAAMRQHPTDMVVQWYGHDALGALLSTTKRREVMKRFRESGGVEVVRQALDNHDFPRQKNVTDLLEQ
mmetsp:Transcript_8621/g.14606  ORF Transcript_8621/g.14606 Transcript_8621/m.14606 type:complete len:193 (-) Transcript_8621:1256-1834(-)